MQFTVELLINGQTVGANEGDVAVSFVTATAVMGEPRGGEVGGAGEAIFDDVRLIRGGVNLLGNSGFEDPVVGPTPNTGVIFDNWKAYYPDPPTRSSAPPPERVTSPVKTGSYAGRIRLPDTAQYNNRYFFQDVALASGDIFDLDFWVYPVSRSASFGMMGQILFDWDRSQGGPTSASVVPGPAATTFQAWGVGGSAPPIPEGQWSHLILRLSTESGWSIGRLQLR